MKAESGKDLFGRHGSLSVGVQGWSLKSLRVRTRREGGPSELAAGRGCRGTCILFTTIRNWMGGRPYLGRGHAFRTIDTGGSVFRNQSLKVKLPIYLTTALAAVTFALAAMAYSEVRRAAVATSSARLERHAAQLSALVARAIPPMLGQVAQLAAEPQAARSLDEGRWDGPIPETFTEVLGVPQVVGIGIYDLDGRLVHDVDGHGVPTSLEVGGFAPEVGQLSALRWATLYPAIAPIRIEDRSVGRLAVWRRAEIGGDVREAIADLISPEAQVLIGNDGGWTDFVLPADGPESFPQEAFQAGYPPNFYVRADGERVFGAAAAVDGTQWYVIVEFPEAFVFESARTFLVRLMLLLPFALLVVAVVAMSIGAAVTKSVRETAAAAEAMAKGAVGQRVTVRGEDELGRLASSFNSMAQQVEESRAALSELNRSLAMSNAELEDFAYLASHDLREPVRMVRSFTQRLADRYAGQLDEEADRYIHFAVDGAERMEGLIRGLLEYSRLEGDPAPPTVVQSEAVVDVALDNLAERIEDAGGVVTVDRSMLPQVYGDSAQLARVFQNLISNGLKFHKKGVAPRIEVGAEPDQDRHVFYVRDNGIGIREEYYDRVFVIFKRLHGAEYFPGAGMGLAICRKIVERHGGEIWVESEPGQGSTFYFALPSTVAKVA